MEEALLSLSSEITRIQPLLGAESTILRTCMDEVLYKYRRTVTNMFPTGILEIEYMIFDELDDESLCSLFN